ncbi:MAG: acyl-CoA thioesterase [bacterium]
MKKGTEEKAGMKHMLDVKVYYEDTDCGGVVYYGKYLGFLERARTEYLESRGIRLIDLMAEGIYFVVAHVDIDYRSSAHYGDVISISSEIGDVTAATVTFRHELFQKGSPDKAIATASVKLACVGRTMRPQRLKPEIMNALRNG